MIDEVIKYFGSRKKLYTVLNASKSACSYWVKDGYLPTDKALLVEFITNGKFKALEISNPKILFDFLTYQAERVKSEKPNNVVNIQDYLK